MDKAIEGIIQGGPVVICVAMYLFFHFKTRGQKVGKMVTDNTPAPKQIESLARDLLDYSQIKSDVRLLANNHEHEAKISEDSKGMINKRIDALEDMFKKHLEESAEARIARERREERKDEVTIGLLKQILEKGK